MISFSIVGFSFPVQGMDPTLQALARLFPSAALFLDLCRSSLERAGAILYVGRVRLVVGISDLAVPYRAELEEGVVGFQISTVKTVCDEKKNIVYDIS